MSKTIDEKVVEMRFDNSRFEQNVSQSMSTLDKLKQKLNLSGASKGLENIQTTASKINMSGLANSVDTVSSRFSALEVMGVTALANITNSAVNTGKKMISALTIDPIKTGFQEYETQMNAVQTILANTQSKGSTLDDVNKALDTLNKYADLTIYNFTEMTRNIGTFTAAGVDLQTSVDSIQGIANLAAVSGSSSQQASVAMYQLSQALAAGRVSLQDWNSVVNAGMGGELFQTALLRTSELLKTGGKEAVKSYGSFRESLTRGKWLTTEVLTETLKQLSGAYSEADLIAQGFTKEQAKEIASLAQTATDAATKVKTFTQLWDVMKEAAQSGWARTWQLIIGDFEEAKSLLTPLSDFFTNIIGKISDARNKLLESALGKSFTDLGKKISGVMEPINKTAKSVKGAIKTVEDYKKVVNEILAGDWGNGKSRWDKLTEAGFDWAHAQNLVNERVGDSTRHATKYKEAQDAVTESQEKSAETSGKLSKEQAKVLESLIKMSDAELKAKGYTDEQIKAFRELESVSKKLGIPIQELVTNLDEINGRWLLINSFKNIGSSIVKIFKAIGEAWRDAFPPMQADQLFNIIAAFHRFSLKLKMSDETAENLTRTLKGVFAILDIILTIVGGPIKIAFKIFTQMLGAFNLNILDVTAYIGDAIVRFRDFLDSALDFTAVFKRLAPYIKKATDAIKEWLAGIKDTEVVKTISEYAASVAESMKEWFTTLKDEDVLSTFISYAKKAGAAMKEWFASLKDTKLFELLSTYLKASAEGIKEWFDSLKDSDNIPRDIISGLVNGLKSGIKMAASIAKELAITILDTVKSLLGIHSPSTEFYDIGKNVVLGFFNGIKDFVAMLYDLVMSIGAKVIEIVKNLDLGSIITGVIGSGFIIGFLKIAKAIEALTGPLKGVGEVLESTSLAIKSFSKVLGSVGNLINAQALKTVAISIAILVGSVALLTLLPAGKVWASIGAIAALGAILVALTIAMGKWGPSDGVQFGKMSALLLSLSGSVLILGIALKIISSIKPEAMQQTLNALWNITGMLIAIMVAFSLFSKYGKALGGTGDTLLKMAGSIAIMAIIIKMFAKMEPDAIKQGEFAILGLVGIMSLLMLVSKIGNSKKVGDMLLRMAGAIAVLAFIVKMFAKMEPDAIKQGEFAILGLVGIMSLLMLVSKIANFKKVGIMLAQLAGAMALLGLTIAILGRMDPSAILQGELAIVGLVAIITGLMLAVKKFGKDAAGIGKTILLISISIGLLAGVAILLGMVNIKNLAKGIVAVAMLAALAAGLVYATKYAGGDVYKSMIGIAMAIGVMAAAVAVLSFIKPGKLAIATGAMTILIGMLAVLVKATGQVNGSLGVLIVITIAMGMMGTILFLLAKMPIQNTLGAATALSLLLVTMTGILFTLSKMNVSVGNALKGVLGLLALCVPLLAIAGILYMMKNVNNALVNATALTLLATALTMLLIPLSVIGVVYAATGGTAALGLLGLLGMCVPLLAIAGILYMMKNINNAVTNAMALTLLITAMGDICFKLALVGPLALIGVTALTALTTLIMGIGVFAVGIGALMQKIPVLKSFLDTGISILIQLAGGIGKMIGAFVGGVMTEIATTLPAIGLCLSQFMNNAMIFIMGAKMIDEKVLAGVGILAGAIVALTAADFITGVLSFLQGGSSFADLGTQLSQFMMNSVPFITMAKMIDPKIMTGVKTLAEAILVLTGANMLETITKFLGGESSLASFGSQLGDLGTNMKTFVTNLGTFTEDQVATVDCAGKAIKALAEAASAIPNEGGWAAKILGDNSLGAFGSKLPQLGTDLSGFINNLGTFTSDQVTTVDCAGKAIKALAETANTIPDEGGLWSKIVGDNSLATFSSKLPQLGTDLSGFITNLGTFGEDSINTVKCAGQAIKVLAEAANTIPDEGGLWSKIVGDNSLATFGSKLPQLGSDISGFVMSLGTFGEGQIATVNSACTAIAAIADLGKIDLGTTSSGIEKVGTVLSKFSGGLTSFVNKMSEVGAENINSAVEKTNKLIELAKTAANTNIESLGTFGSSLKKVATDGVNGFVGAFTGDDPVNKIKKAASKLLKTFVDSAKSTDNKSKLKSAGTDVGKAASGGMDSSDVITDAKEAGKNVVTGFANGITNNKSLATNAGGALGRAALKAAKDALDEHSPSKEMYKVGNFAGIGFINALYDNISQAYKAGTNVANSAKSGISEAVAKISDIVDSDIDAQPTIRPVIDLNDVKSGVNSINGLLNIQSSVGVSSNIHSINRMMNRRQTGVTNSDVVSAIKDLGKKVGTTPSNTYNINGITYDNGSEVANAIEVLARAAIIERRT